MNFISNILKIIILAVVVLFAVMNVQQVELTYFFNAPAIKMPLFVVILASLMIGLVLTSMFYFFERLKFGSEIRKLKKQVKAGEEEIKRLRSLPFNSNSSGEA